MVQIKAILKKFAGSLDNVCRLKYNTHNKTGTALLKGISKDNEVTVKMKGCPKEPEEVFVVFMDFLEDIELYGRNPKAFKELLGVTLKQRAQQMRLYLAAIPRETWLDIHRLIMFAPEMKEILENLVKSRTDDDARREKYRADTLLEGMRNWTEPQPY